MISAGSNLATQTVLLSGGIVLPLKRTEVGKCIGATLGNGSDVVNLPSVLAGSVTVVGPTYPGAALVFTPDCRVVIGDDLRLLPDSKFSFFAKICHFLTGLVKHPAPMVSTLQLLSEVAVRAAETLTTFSFHGKYTAKGLENDKLAESTFGFCKKITGIRSKIIDF